MRAYKDDRQYSRRTQDLMAQYLAAGWEIICGNDWRLAARPKWQDHECVRLARTNSRRHGYCVSTVWAVRWRTAIPVTPVSIGHGRATWEDRSEWQPVEVIRDLGAPESRMEYEAELEDEED